MIKLDEGTLREPGAQSQRSFLGEDVAPRTPHPPASPLVTGRRQLQPAAALGQLCAHRNLAPQTEACSAEDTAYHCVLASNARVALGGGGFGEVERWGLIYTKKIKFKSLRKKVAAQAI